ncbi:hypothetical protein L1I79_05345 [Strepomyces sp. STD 3.1]|uniref:hypothetical protein n=1 Tax=Streptomyces sp. NPDC058985 TaxID=3346684 RepID=UPI001F266658|nr:hypothetical protein [Streptomyces sp. STD 3.1]
MTGLVADYVDAPVLVLLCAPTQHVASKAIGDLLVRAGSLGYALWLAARTHGLEATVFGGAHTPLRLVPGMAEGHGRHLFTVALGYPEQHPASGRE